MYTKGQFAKLIDHTYLKPTATGEEIARVCADAKKHHFASVVVFPYWVPMADKLLDGCDVKVSTVIGFPHGALTRSSKVYEVKNSVANGADELDVVINIGALKSGDLDFVRREISDILNAANSPGVAPESRGVTIKFIIETPYLTEQEKISVCEIGRSEGVDFIKTSTGTAPNGATEEDVALIRRVVGQAIGIKAAGGIRTIEHAINLLDAGANRLGTSSGVALVQEYDPDEMMKAVR